jgi:acylphosphatase
MADKARLHVLIDGRVQGVFFRAHTRDEARVRGLTGWVRNLPDGRVEALFEGERPALTSMLAWCRLGPRYSYVDSVTEDWQPYQGDFSDFRIRY